jgi:hypothetical protein
VSDTAEIRAALIQLAKALETERACVLRILKVVERQMEAEETPIPVAISTMQRSVNENNV